MVCVVSLKHIIIIKCINFYNILLLCRTFVWNLSRLGRGIHVGIDFLNHFRYLPFISALKSQGQCRQSFSFFGGQTNTSKSIGVSSNPISINVWSEFWIKVKPNVWLLGNWIHQRIYVDDWLVDWLTSLILASQCICLFWFWTRVQSCLILLILYTVIKPAPLKSRPIN